LGQGKTEQLESKIHFSEQWIQVKLPTCLLFFQDA